MSARMIEILRSRDLELAEFRAMQLPVADALATLYEIAQRTAAHFEDTDAPLGIAARAALAKVDA
jgi:hypothetical protein